VANDDRLFLHGMYEHHLLLFRFVSEANEWVEVPVERSPARLHVAPFYWRVESFGSRCFFIGGRDPREGQERRVVALLAVLDMGEGHISNSV
ncbi:hypothetical protein PMAYCL1PPCAC_01109, partial [Pristionchus mayeri]